MQTDIQNTRICFKEQIRVFVWYSSLVHNEDLKLVFVRAYVIYKEPSTVMQSDNICKQSFERVAKVAKHRDRLFRKFLRDYYHTLKIFITDARRGLKHAGRMWPAR